MPAISHDSASGFRKQRTSESQSRRSISLGQECLDPEAAQPLEHGLQSQTDLGVDQAQKRAPRAGGGVSSFRAHQAESPDGLDAGGQGQKELRLLPHLPLEVTKRQCSLMVRAWCLVSELGSKQPNTHSLSLSIHVYKMGTLPVLTSQGCT